jgi:hypothetical protein
MLNKSPNRIASLDIFLMLDWENDQYLKQVEVEPMWDFVEKLNEKDRGKITSKDELIKFFRKHQYFQIGVSTFNELLDESEVNVSKLRDAMYNSKYVGHGCCKLFKRCNRRFRNYNLRGMIKKEDMFLKE